MMTVRKKKTAVTSSPALGLPELIMQNYVRPCTVMDAIVREVFSLRTTTIIISAQQVPHCREFSTLKFLRCCADMQIASDLLLQSLKTWLFFFPAEEGMNAVVSEKSYKCHCF